MKCHVYILFSESHNKYYVGQTKSINARLESHNNGKKVSYTSKYRPWSMFWSLEVKDRSTAMKIEKYLKNKRSDFYKRLKCDSKLQDYIIEKYS